MASSHSNGKATSAQNRLLENSRILESVTQEKLKQWEDSMLDGVTKRFLQEIKEIKENKDSVLIEEPQAVITWSKKAKNPPSRKWLLDQVIKKPSSECAFDQMKRQQSSTCAFMKGASPQPLDRNRQNQFSECSLQHIKDHIPIEEAQAKSPSLMSQTTNSTWSDAVSFPGTAMQAAIRRHKNGWQINKRGWTATNAHRDGQLNSGIPPRASKTMPISQSRPVSEKEARNIRHSAHSPSNTALSHQAINEFPATPLSCDRRSLKTERYSIAKVSSRPNTAPTKMSSGPKTATKSVKPQPVACTKKASLRLNPSGTFPARCTTKTVVEEQCGLPKAVEVEALKSTQPSGKGHAPSVVKPAPDVQCTKVTRTSSIMREGSLLWIA